jgi:superfamily II DNA or RNA helicase
MPKAVLSNRIFMEASPEIQEKIRKELSYTIPAYRPDEPPITIRNMSLIRPGLISIPSGRMDLIPKDYEVVDKRVEVPIEMPEFRGVLRPSQQAIYEEIEDSAIINAWVSFGKTFTAIAIAGLFGQKTLVVCHTIPLMNQWVREVKKCYGFTPGIIGSNKFNDTTPIVVGSVRTLYKNMDRLHKSFGLVILDEMHHVSSPIFSRIIDKSCARYKIGLSGTIKRKDGKHVVFKDYFGQKIFKPPRENYMEPEVHVYKCEVRLPDGASIPWAKRINTVAYNEDYQHTIALIASAYAARGHKVLAVSDRVALLDKCAELVGEKAISVTGKISHEERETLLKEIADGKKEILFGTQSIFSEGISLDNLSCLVLGTPINNEPLLTQLVGRVIRELEGKPQPVVVDINLKGNTARRQAQDRLGFYMKQGWKVKHL